MLTLKLQNEKWGTWIPAQGGNDLWRCDAPHNVDLAIPPMIPLIQLQIFRERGIRYVQDQAN